MSDPTARRPGTGTDPGTTTPPSDGQAIAATGRPVDADGDGAVLQAPPPSMVPDRPPVPRAMLAARVALGVVLAVVALYAPFYFTPERNLLLSQALYIAIAAMGLNLLTGFTGQVSIGHGAFFGLGAFTTAILMQGFELADAFYMGAAPAGSDVHLSMSPMSFEATLPIAVLLTGALGLLVGFPALRVRGLYLALVTLGLAVLLPQVLNRFVVGVAGNPLVQPPRRQFSSLVTFLDDDQWVYFFCLAMALVLFLAVRNLVNTRVGRAMVACRDQELAATTVGVNLAATKVTTFALSAAYAGIAGSLSVMVEGRASGINPTLYFQYSIQFLVAMVIGGTATILGPLVGAFLLLALERNTRGLIEGKEILSPALFGAALIAVVYVLPDGVVGGVRRLMVRLWGRRPAASPSEPPVREPT